MTDKEFNENELLFDELYEKTKDCGRVQFINLLMEKERENRQLKEELEVSEKARKTLKEINEYRKETGGYPSEMLDKLLDILDIDKGE